MCVCARAHVCGRARVHACLHPVPLMCCRMGVQVVNGSMYVAGEIKPYQTRNESVKRQLMELVRLTGPLPDLDVYFDSQDHAEYCLAGTSDACK